MIFIDAGVLLASEDAADANHEDSVRLLASGQPLATLDLALYEVTNVAAVRWKDEDAAERLRGRIRAIEGDGELVRVDCELMGRAYGRAVEYELSGYDAAYVVASGRLGAPLASCDQRDLVSAGHAQLPAAFVGG